MRHARLFSFLVLVVAVTVVAGCSRSPEAARRALASSDPAERRKAATALQAMYARNPSSIGDHGEAYWAERLEKARGKKTAEAVAILDGAQLSGGEAGGGGESLGARLDDFWVATLGRSTRGDDIVFETGKPRRNVIHVDADRPAAFTGTWTTYYVHGAVYETMELRGGVFQRIRQFHEGGQLWSEIPYVDGKADGTVVTRSPNGTLEREETWSKGKQVSERSFFANGRVETETTYRDGHIERQRSFRDTGAMTSCEVFRSGVPEPCPD